MEAPPGGAVSPRSGGCSYGTTASARPPAIRAVRVSGRDTRDSRPKSPRPAPGPRRPDALPGAGLLSRIADRVAARGPGLWDPL
ncbi:hypothetical protein SUDANB1_03899 [Streptomyces sp. enrichment culture]